MVTGEAAERELIAIIESHLDEVSWMSRAALAKGIVEELVLERQDILAALHKHPKRWWFMERDTEVPKSPPVWLGGDEFDNRTIVFWWPRQRWLVVSLSLRLKRELMR